MTTRAKLRADLTAQYLDSLVRVDGEKDHQSEILKRFENELQVPAKVARRTLAALHKDKLNELHNGAQCTLDFIGELQEDAPTDQLPPDPPLPRGAVRH